MKLGTMSEVSKIPCTKIFRVHVRRGFGSKWQFRVEIVMEFSEEKIFHLFIFGPFLMLSDFHVGEEEKGPVLHGIHSCREFSKFWDTFP